MILPKVQAAVSLTATLGSRSISMMVGRACSTSGARLSVLGPSMMEPKHMTAASLERQSASLMLTSMNGRARGTISSVTTVASRVIQVPAAFETVHSSSSVSSSWILRRSHKTGRSSVRATRAKLKEMRSGSSPYSRACRKKEGKRVGCQIDEA